MRVRVGGRSRAAANFYVINVLLLPITLIGYLIWMARIYVARRASGASISAQGPLSARALMHQFGLRRDEAAYRLLMALPSTSSLAVLLAGGPLLLAHRLTGYVPSAFRYPFEGDIPPQFEAPARVTFVDAAVERYLATINQFVILGAGFDTRAFRLPRPGQIRCFEVDTPRTQASKRQMLRKAESTRPATANGSALVFDYFTTEPLRSPALYWRFARAATRAAGEPLRFGIDSIPPSRDRLIELLQSCGLALAEQRTLGQETEDKRAWGGFAVATLATKPITSPGS